MSTLSVRYLLIFQVDIPNWWHAPAHLCFQETNLADRTQDGSDKLLGDLVKVKLCPLVLEYTCTVW